MSCSWRIVPGLVLTALLGLACAPGPEPEPTGIAAPRGPFFGMTPDDTPRRPAPGWLGTSLDEYNAVFSSAGDAFFFTVDTPERSFIMATYLGEDGSWSPPEAVPFSASKRPDYDPFLSFDDRRLYFSSRRPTTERPEGDRSHLWYVDRGDDGVWSEPILLPLTERGDFYTSATRSGELFFNVWSLGDIFRAIPDDEGYTVEPLPGAINDGPRDVGDPYISPDGDYLIFRGYGEDSLGRGDLFISFLVDGAWTPRRNLGASINSERHEMCPWVSADGRWFTFASARIDEPYTDGRPPTLERLANKHRAADNGQLNLYMMSADFIEGLRP